MVNCRIVCRSQGDLESVVTWRFQPEAEGTRVTFEAGYGLPAALRGRLTEAWMAQQVEDDAVGLLANLKVRLETGGSRWKPSVCPGTHISRVLGHCGAAEKSV
jgi:hypothetical protein